MEQTTQASPSKNPSHYTQFDVELLTRHVTDTGKILPRRITGLSSKQHRHMTHAIKRARHLLLMK